MLKLCQGNQIINLVKDAKGSQRAGHKYCKREPLGDGSGFKYWYPAPGGKCGDGKERSEDLTHAKARERHPEDYDPSRPRFNISDKAADKINHSSYANSDEKRFGSKNKLLTFKQYVNNLKKLYSGNQSSAIEGILNEYMHTFSKEIGDGRIDSIDDLISYTDSIVKKFGNQTDAYSKEITQEALVVLANLTALNDLPQDTVGGAARLERLWDNAAQFWNETRVQFRNTYGSDFNMDNVRIRMSGKDVGSDRKADLFTEVFDDEAGKWDANKFAISLKINTGRPISWSEGSPITALVNIFSDSGIASLQKLSVELDVLYNNLNKKFNKTNYPNLSGDELNREIMYRFKNEFYNKFGIDKGAERTESQKSMLADFARLAMKQTIDLHKDPRTANLAISMMSIDSNTGKANHIGCSARALERVWDNFFNSGTISVEWGKTGNTFMSSTGEEIPVISDIKFIGGAENKRKVFAIVEGRHTKKSIQWRGPQNFHIEMMMKASKIDDGFGYLKERISIADKKSRVKKSREDERINVVLIKSTQTLERKKMNAKYIRKELTESGNVRYIYRETNPRRKKEDEQEPANRNQFLSTLDSVDPVYKTLFEDAIGEIADEHFVNINAGSASIRITKDVDVFLDVLSVPKELRNDEEFTNASGSFNVSKGVMAFCTSNFPGDVSEMVKKAIMMHEVGHAYFYGTLRIKHKKPLAEIIESKDKVQKDFAKNSTKFVDTFGKMDEELRKKAEFDVANVKGQDKETLFQDAIKTYMVSEYATLSGEEHFAEAFSRYFVMPEQLKKKEKEVYDHFEAFFQKYGE